MRIRQKKGLTNCQEAISVRNLNKQFGGVHAVHNCTLDINRGIITSIIGPNGAGKTTLFNLICGITKPDSGKIFLNGENITGLPTYKIAKKGVSRTFQQAKLFKNMTVKENLDLAQSKDLLHEIEESFSNLKPNKIQSIGKNEKDICEQVPIPIEKEKRAGELSFGQSRLVELARAMIMPHSVLLLDEPTAGVNPKVRTELKQILRDLRKKGMTIALIEHDMEFVMSISDEVIVMAEGYVLVRGSPERIQKDKRVLEVYLGK